MTDHLGGIPALPAAGIHALSAQVANGAGIRVAAAVPPELRPAVDAAARAGTISGLNLILLLAGVAAALAAIIGLVFSRAHKAQATTPTTLAETTAAPKPQLSTPTGRTHRESVAAEGLHAHS